MHIRAAFLSVFFLISASAALAADTAVTSYNCGALSPNNGGFFGGTSKISLSFKGNLVHVVDLDERAQATGKLDPSFKRGASASFFRYVGLEALSGESGQIYLLVSKNVANGAKKIGAVLNWRGESFDSARFGCVRVK